MSKARKQHGPNDRSAAGRKGNVPARGKRSLKTAVVMDAVVRNGQLHVERPVRLADGTPVRVTVTPADHDPIAAVIGIGESGRTDGADNHNHYIYGTPRR